MDKNYFKKTSEELLFYSGQFGMFYIIMQIIMSKTSFFFNAGHLSLLFSLLAQILLLARYGNRIKYRFIYSFIVPAVYSLIELTEGLEYFLNAAHVGFWIYALVSFLLMYIKLKNQDKSQKSIEVLFVLLNIFIFLFIYYYLDTWKEIQNIEQLQINIIFNHLYYFLNDPTHWFIIVGGALLAFTISLGRYEIENLKERVTYLFGKYIDENVRDTIIKTGEYTAKNDKLCVLFSDIKDFTILCEHNNAQTISEMLNTYFDFWNELVKKHNGTVDKFIGDAIMVIFGLEHKNNACNLAINCSLEMYKKKQDLDKRLKEKGLPIPGFGIGCHFGDLIIGDLGSTERKNFTVIGDTVNIASRLESITRKVESDIIISESVFINLDKHLQNCFKHLGKSKLKGRNAPVEVWGNNHSKN